MSRELHPPCIRHTNACARAAGGLRSLGIGEDDSVALMLRNDFATFEVNMAAGQLGAYAVPINWHFTPEEAGYILMDCAAKVLVAHSDLLAQIASGVPAGVKVLKQVGDVLNKISDKQIRIEGHTDNVPISSKLQDRFRTNWELSTARATTVVRYLIDQGGVDRQYLSAVGYADTHPLASNDSEEGRSSNRRIEIVLYPKDLKEIAGQVETSTAASK